MIIDFWYNNKLEDVTGITCSFNDCDCIYRGWLMSGDKIIGDYCTPDSTEIETMFPFFRF